MGQIVSSFWVWAGPGDLTKLIGCCFQDKVMNDGDFHLASTLLPSLACSLWGNQLPRVSSPAERPPSGPQAARSCALPSATDLAPTEAGHVYSPTGPWTAALTESSGGQPSVLTHRNCHIVRGSALTFHLEITVESQLLKKMQKSLYSGSPSGNIMHKWL